MGTRIPGRERALALADARARFSPGRGGGGEGSDKSVILKKVSDHRRPPSDGWASRTGAADGETGLMSRYWMSCSAIFLKLGAATVAP